MKTSLFWVRIYNLPLMVRNYYIGEVIGKSLGVVEEVDLDLEEVEWGVYAGKN